MPTFKKIPPEKLDAYENEPTPSLIGSLRARTTTKTFNRGQEYHRSGMISGIEKDGETIYGECQGSEDIDYEVEVRIRGNEIIEADCSCPYEMEGDCKHIVALVLTYIEQSTKIVDVGKRNPQVRPLAERSKEELIALIEEMVSLHRDLKAILNRPSPSVVQEHLVDLHFVQDQLRLAIKKYEPYSGNRIALNHIHTIIKTARTFATAGDWRNTARICRALWDNLNSHNEYPVYDEEGEFMAAVAESIPLMEECLSQPDFRANDDERFVMLDCFLRTILWETHYVQIGDISYDLGELLTAFTTIKDLPALKNTLESALQAISPQSYSRKSLVELLNNLEYAINPNPQILIDRLTSEKDFGTLARKYIEWEQYDNAITVLKTRPVMLGDLTSNLDALIQVHHAKEAIPLAVEHIERHFEPQLVEWLIRTYTNRGDHSSAFQWAHRYFLRQPHIRTYRSLKEISQRLSTWKAVRTKLYEEFAWEDKHQMLFEMLLEDQEWERAWELLPRLGKKPEPYYAAYSRGNSLRLAMASYRTHPSNALPILKERVEWHISQRTRSAYAEAAEVLGMVRTTQELLNQKEEWKAYIATLRTTYKNLPAFQDELRKAKL